MIHYRVLLFCKICTSLFSRVHEVQKGTQLLQFFTGLLLFFYDTHFHFAPLLDLLGFCSTDPRVQIGDGALACGPMWHQHCLLYSICLCSRPTTTNIMYSSTSDCGRMREVFVRRAMYVIYYHRGIHTAIGHEPRTKKDTEDRCLR